VITKNWKRAGIGACTAAALVVGAGLAFSPAANAAPAADPTTNLLGGVTTSVNGVVTGLLGSTTSTPTASSPVTIGTANGGIAVGLGSTTVGVTTGSSGLGVGVTTGNSSGVGVVIGSTTTGTTAAVGVTNPSTGTTTTTTPAGTSTTTPTDTSSTSPASTPIMLTALSAVAQYKTVYPAKDGYRDTVNFTLNGTTSDGQQHAASGTAKLTYGSSTVQTWPITATNQVINWNGLKGGKILPGHYVFTATIGSAANSVSGTDSVDSSAKKLASTTQLVTSKSVSGTHKMSAKPLAGLKTGKVTLRIVSSVSHLKGKQYLVFKHAGKSFKVRILNGKHTSKAVTVPKAFTSFTISHTWKKSVVKIKSLKYKYTYKALK
jgi:hypothetical protein